MFKMILMLLMKNKKTYLPIVIFFLLTSFGVLHKFYVSVTQIDFNEKNLELKFQPEFLLMI